MTTEPKPITWTGPAGSPVAGRRFTHGTPVTFQGETMVDFGTQKIGKKYQGLKVRVSDKPDLAAEVERYERESAEYLAAKKAAAEAEVEAIRSGAKPIEVNYHDGEYLSGYSVYGPASDMLCDLGLARDVSGWGTHVEDQLVDALGKSFTLPQAAEFSRPEREEKAAKVAAKKKAREDAVAAAHQRAKETGDPVVLSTWTEERRVFEEGEWGDYQFVVYEYVGPDGKIFTKAVNTY